VEIPATENTGARPAFAEVFGPFALE